MSKKDHDTFHLNVRFIVAATSVSDATAEAKITRWCDMAESLFDAKPSLHINREIVPSDNPLTAADLTFESSRDLHKFMDTNFDNVVGNRRTEGCVQVLVVDNITVGGNSGIAGSAFFPHCVTPFGRKHGILMEIGAPDSSLPHEFGHLLSLKHTFEDYVGFKGNCNKGITKVQGGSRVGTTINLMDYNRLDSDTIVLNSCQSDRAAHQRRMYMTREGATNYRDLAGLR